MAEAIRRAAELVVEAERVSEFMAGMAAGNMTMEYTKQGVLDAIALTHSWSEVRKLLTPLVEKEAVRLRKELARALTPNADTEKQSG